MPSLTANDTLLKVRRALGTGYPEAANTAFEAVIIATDTAFIGGFDEAKAYAIAAQRCVRQGITSAQANLINALAADGAPRRALAELARLQMENVMTTLSALELEDRGVLSDDNFLRALEGLVNLTGEAVK